jgi:hypothetical protein
MSELATNRYSQQYEYIPNSMLFPGLEHVSDLLYFTERRNNLSIS